MVQTQKIYLMQFLDLGLSYGGLELPSPSCMQPVGSKPCDWENVAQSCLIKGLKPLKEICWISEEEGDFGRLQR